MPGEAGVWIFVFGDMILFSVFFLVFMYERSKAVESFQHSHAHLNQSLGALNTIFLLTSSWAVATAMALARKGVRTAATKCLIGAMLCGGLFIGTKYLEYSEKIASNITLTSDDFFMFYYMLTGIHLLHVFIGMGVLLLMVRLSAGARQGNWLTHMESGASFWHVVDLLWIVLFALLYLLP